MEFISPLLPHKAIKKANRFFQNSVNNSKVKEEPLSPKDSQALEIGVSAIYGEIYWIKVLAEQARNKTTTIFLKGRMSSRQLLFSAIVFLLATPFLYLAISGDWPGTLITYFFAFFVGIIGIMGFIVPIIRINNVCKSLKKVLMSEDETYSEKLDLPTKKSISTRVE